MQTYNPKALIQTSDQPLETDAARSSSDERETTVDSLCTALDTATSQPQPALSKPTTWLDEFLVEAACLRAVELACVIGVEAALQNPVQQEPFDKSLQAEEIGPYQLLSWWGQGGMGTVYRLYSGMCG